MLWCNYYERWADEVEGLVEGMGDCDYECENCKYAVDLSKIITSGIIKASKKMELEAQVSQSVKEVWDALIRFIREGERQ